jgi:hypothetical protein
VNAKQRQAYALANPLGRADSPPGSLRALPHARKHATGLLMKSILAVDR